MFRTSEGAQEYQFLLLSLIFAQMARLRPRICNNTSLINCFDLVKIPLLLTGDPLLLVLQMSSEGTGLGKVLEWSDDTIVGNRNTSVCSFLSGVLIYGPDEHLRVSLKIILFTLSTSSPARFMSKLQQCAFESVNENGYISYLKYKPVHFAKS